MGKTSSILAALLLVGLAVAFGLSYVRTAMPPQPIQAPPEFGGGWNQHFTEVLADQMADRLSGQVRRYCETHGRFPAVAEFWQILGCSPIHNPLNGSASVVKMRIDLDATEVGWVYDLDNGIVYPGAVFNAGQPLTRPSTQQALVKGIE